MDLRGIYVQNHVHQQIFRSFLNPYILVMHTRPSDTLFFHLYIYLKLDPTGSDISVGMWKTQPTSKYAVERPITLRQLRLLLIQQLVSPYVCS